VTAECHGINLPGNPPLCGVQNAPSAKGGTTGNASLPFITWSLQVQMPLGGQSVRRLSRKRKTNDHPFNKKWEVFHHNRLQEWVDSIAYPYTLCRTAFYPTHQVLHPCVSLQYCAKVMQTKFGKFRSLFSRKFSSEISREISCEKFHCQTIFRAKFQGNIARYFRRTNEKSLFRKFAEAKFCAATIKLMSNKMKQFKYGKVTEM